MNIFYTWWAWLSLSALLLMLELFLPTFLFLGFSIGAAATSLLVYFTDFTVTVYILIFAVLSLISWVGLRKLYPPVKITIHHDDINEN